MKRVHYIGPIPLLLTAATALAACGGGGGGDSTGASASAGGRQAVAIRDFRFMPRTIIVRKGARITISNRDSTAHTATSDDGSSFDTGNVDSGSSSAVTLDKTGRFPYHCSIHPFMHGTVVVRGGSG